MTSKVAIITGGSAGLGLHLAEALVQQRARVTIVGRDPQRLQAAVEHLQGVAVSPADVHGDTADVTVEPRLQGVLESTAARYGRLDLLINCAGVSMRGLASQVSADEFRRLFELNALAALRCSQQALPWLRQSRGQIINIGSLASRIATPQLGAYPASKFALAAISEQLRRELHAEGMHVLTVFPGPLTRTDAGQRYGQQAQGLNEVASRPGGSRLSSMSPAVLSRKILRAADRRRAEWMPLQARLFCILSLCSPKLGDWIARKMTS